MAGYLTIEVVSRHCLITIHIRQSTSIYLIGSSRLREEMRSSLQFNFKACAIRINNKWQKDHSVGPILAKTITDFDRWPGR